MNLSNMKNDSREEMLMLRKPRLDTWVTLGFIAFFVGILLHTRSYDPQVVEYPKSLLMICIVLSAAVLVETLVKEKTGVVHVSLEAAKNAAIVFVMISVYAVAVSFFGFAIPTAIFVVVMMLFFGEKNPLVICLVTAVFLAVLWVVFIKLLGVPLPVLPSHIV